jgi:hypothetical protein
MYDISSAQKRRKTLLNPKLGQITIFRNLLISINYETTAEQSLEDKNPGLRCNPSTCFPVFQFAPSDFERV